MLHIRDREHPARSAPDDPEAHLFTDRLYDPIERFVARAGVRVPTRCLVAATLTFLQVAGVYQFGSGYVRGRLLYESPQQYMHEVAVLHAI